MSTKSSVWFIELIARVDDSYEKCIEIHVYNEMIDGKFYITVNDSRPVRFPRFLVPKEFKRY